MGNLQITAHRKTSTCIAYFVRSLPSFDFAVRALSLTEKELPPTFTQLLQSLADFPTQSDGYMLSFTTKIFVWLSRGLSSFSPFQLCYMMLALTLADPLSWAQSPEFS